MSECTHDCSSCSSNCSERTQPESFIKPMNKNSNIKKVIGVVSGKGGVGKSLVSCLLASKCRKAGLKVGILDADITGPSVPKSFGITSRAMQDETGLLPTVTESGIKMIVNKAFNMAKMMNVPVLGLVENMSYYVCPHCNEKISIFGESQIDETAKELGVPVLAKLPINPDAAKMIDAGRVEDIEAGELDEFVDTLK